MSNKTKLRASKPPKQKGVFIGLNRLDKIEQAVKLAIRKNGGAKDEYSRGVANGLMLAVHILTNKAGGTPPQIEADVNRIIVSA